MQRSLIKIILSLPLISLIISCEASEKGQEFNSQKAMEAFEANQVELFLENQIASECLKFNPPFTEGLSLFYHGQGKSKMEAPFILEFSPQKQYFSVGCNTMATEEFIISSDSIFHHGSFGNNSGVTEPLIKWNSSSLFVTFSGGDAFTTDLDSVSLIHGHLVEITENELSYWYYSSREKAKIELNEATIKEYGLMHYYAPEKDSLLHLKFNGEECYHRNVWIKID